jgi:hypothetical protein
VAQSLYRRVLGAQFEELPEVLKRFHDTPGGGRARGTLRVERAPGRLLNGLASLLRMPPAAAEVAVRLAVIVEGERERWIRQFDEFRVETVQWARADLLMEAFGPVSFACKLVLDGATLRYDFRRAWLAGIPLPRYMGPSVEGSVFAAEMNWRIAVRIIAPFIGAVVRYEGWVEPE